MKKRLHTSFIKFIIEKYDKEIPEEETNCPDEKLIDEFDKIMGYGEEENNEVQDDKESTEKDDETIDDLIKEYRSLTKKYKMKTNGCIRNKRK